jgi:predicted flap endonuclease-1-like 5' DNA nuclease
MGFIERIKSALRLGSATSSPGSASGTNRRADEESGTGGEPTPVSEIEGDDDVEVAQTVVDPDDRGDDDVDVTVEHEPDTRSEDAVKGTDTAGTGTSADVEPAETATEASTTETGVDADEIDGESGSAPGQSADEATDTGADADADADTDADAGTDTDTDADATPAGAGVDLEELKGIGPAYASQLREAGIEDVAALAAADAADLAERTAIGEGRLQTFVERAAER